MVPAAEFYAWWEDQDPFDQVEALRLRFRYDRAGFLRFCFPDLFYLPFNGFHIAMLDKPCEHWKDRVPRVHRRVTAAPRGIAKTTLMKGEMIHETVYGLEGYTIIMSADMRGARKITRHLKEIFATDDSELSKIYGPFIIQGGIEEFRVSVDGAKPVGFLARSFGTQVRGAEESAQRPTSIRVDDGERPDRVRNSDRRREWWDFLHEDVLKAGPKEGGLLVDWRGTVLHADSVIQNLLTNPGWDAALWQSIISWPEREDLWADCSKVYRDLTHPDRYDRAEAFYLENKVEMHKGVEVLDPVAEPIFKLYCQIWDEGLSSFLKEKQNTPRRAGTSYYNSDDFARCKIIHGNKEMYVQTADGRHEPLSTMTVVLRLDPIPGKEIGVMGDDGGAGGGDYAAITCLARDRFGYGYVLEMWMRRCRDSEQIEAMWDMAERWGVEYATIESNAFARLLGRDFRKLRSERREQGLYWQVTFDEDHSSTNKEDRIASLEPALAAGWLQFNENIGDDVMKQFDDFPTGAHDDAPDSVEGAWRNSPNGRVPQRRLTP